MRKKYCFGWLIPVLLFLLVFPAGTLHASNEEASKLYAEGRELYLAGNYYDAAKKFEQCEIQADDPVIKANSLLARIGAYRSCQLYFREFKVIEELLERFPDHVGRNCTEYIAREYAIGDWFRNGNREPAFWALRWIPWLTDIDREEEIYCAALKRAPYAAEAPRTHFYLAMYYDKEGQQAKSLGELRLILEHHPESPECKYALLALADGLYQRAGAGDGDGTYMAESMMRFEEFIRRYPDASEVEFVRNRMAQARDVQAKRLYNIASYYNHDGRRDAAIRYLAQIMNDYPDSESAPAAEEMLSEADRTYLPGNFPGRPEARMPQLRAYPIPDNPENELISPLNDNVHYLLPVPDLKGELLQYQSDDNANQEKK